MTTLAARQYQTVFDIALQAYGDLDGGLAKLVKDNPTALTVDGLFPVGVYDWIIDPAVKVRKSVAATMSAVVPVSGEFESEADLPWITEYEPGVTDYGQGWQTEIEPNVTNGEFWTTEQ